MKTVELDWEIARCHHITGNDAYENRRFGLPCFRRATYLERARAYTSSIQGELVKILESLFSETRFDRVIHLAPQAGVRYSLGDPHSYV
ncbi:hypothetical protein [Pelagibacterium sp. H642]|uniref:hypothetical protein n=1 Tax=Pelagibacterium sp. H642 TaxID=1881069 RepID=UPI0035C09C09